MDHGVEGCLRLAQSVDLKQLLPMADSQLTEAESDAFDSSNAGSALSNALSKMQRALSMSATGEMDTADTADADVAGANASYASRHRKYSCDVQHPEAQV